MSGFLEDENTEVCMEYLRFQTYKEACFNKIT